MRNPLRDGRGLDRSTAIAPPRRFSPPIAFHVYHRKPIEQSMRGKIYSSKLSPSGQGNEVERWRLVCVCRGSMTNVAGKSPWWEGLGGSLTLLGFFTCQRGNYKDNENRARNDSHKSKNRILVTITSAMWRGIEYKIFKRTWLQLFIAFNSKELVVSGSDMSSDVQRAHDVVLKLLPQWRMVRIPSAAHFFLLSITSGKESPNKILRWHRSAALIFEPQHTFRYIRWFHSHGGPWAACIKEFIQSKRVDSPAFTHNQVSMTDAEMM